MGTNNHNVGGAGEITDKVACIKVILSYRDPYLTRQDIIVFCVVIFSIWLYYKKRVFQGLALYSHKWLGIARELLGTKV